MVRHYIIACTGFDLGKIVSGGKLGKKNAIWGKISMGEVGSLGGSFIFFDGQKVVSTEIGLSLTTPHSLTVQYLLTSQLVLASNSSLS